MGFNITSERGAHASLSAALAPSASLRSDKKYVTHAGALVPAVDGAHALPLADQERMFKLCQEWMRVWQAHAAESLRTRGTPPVVGFVSSGGGVGVASGGGVTIHTVAKVDSGAVPLARAAANGHSSSSSSSSGGARQDQTPVAAAASGRGASRSRSRSRRRLATSS